MNNDMIETAMIETNGICASLAAFARYQHLLRLKRLAELEGRPKAVYSHRSGKTVTHLVAARRQVKKTAGRSELMKRRARLAELI